MKKLPKLLKAKIFEISVTKKLKISIWVLPLIFSAYICGYGNLYLAAFASSIIHELSHILISRLLKINITCVHIYPFGISAKLQNSYINNSEKEFWIAFAGPFCSFLLFVLFLFFERIYSSELISFLATANLAICAINLVPCLPLDGGRMLKSVLTTRIGIFRAYGFMLRFSRISIIILICFTVFLLVFNQFNFSMVLILAFLLQNLSTEQHSISIIALKKILYNKDKARNFKIMRVKTICVAEDSLAANILHCLTYDFFYVINVLDKSCKIKKVLTESQVLEALTNNGLRLKYKDL